MERKSHWDNVYRRTDHPQAGWYCPHLEKSAQIIDIGGGCSILVDDLLDRGFANITILDLSSHAIETAKKRLGNQSDELIWIEADVTTNLLLACQYDLWHDRAVFHFLTSPEDRNSYVDAARPSLNPNRHLMIATFNPEAPPKRSGLDLV